MYVSGWATSGDGYGALYRSVLALCTHVDSTPSLSLSLSLRPTTCFTSSDSVGYSLGAQDVLQRHSHGAETFLAFLCGAETLLIHVQTHVIRELIHRLIDECREYHTLVPSLWY